MDKNDRWIARNFEKLIDLYGGRTVAVVRQKVVAVGRWPDQVERRARAVTGAKEPAVLRLPRKDSLRIGPSPFRLFGLS